MYITSSTKLSNTNSNQICKWNHAICFLYACVHTSQLIKRRNYVCIRIFFIQNILPCQYQQIYSNVYKVSLNYYIKQILKVSRNYYRPHKKIMTLCLRCSHDQLTMLPSLLLYTNISDMIVGFSFITLMTILANTATSRGCIDIILYTRWLQDFQFVKLHTLNKPFSFMDQYTIRAN